MTRIEELKAEKEKLQAVKAKLQKQAKAKKKTAVIDTTKTVAQKGKNKIPAFMQAEGKY